MCEGGVRSSDMIMLTARALVSFAYQQCIVVHCTTFRNKIKILVTFLRNQRSLSERFAWL